MTADQGVHPEASAGSEAPKRAEGITTRQEALTSQDAEANSGERAEAQPEYLSLLTAEEVAELQAYEQSLQGNDFIRRWVAHEANRTDAPVEFLYLNAIVLVAAAIDRNRWLSFQHKPVYPSIYGIQVAESGDRKTTPMDHAQVALVSGLLRDRLLSNDYSPEALIEDLASRKPKSRGTAYIDEAGRMFGTMRRNNYGEGLKDVFSKAWDAPPSYSRKLRSGEQKMESVYMNVVMGVTPTRFTETTSPEDIASGFLARFLPVVVTERVKRRRIGRMTRQVEQEAAALAEDLVVIYENLAQASEPMPISDGALERLDQAERDLVEEWAPREFHAELIEPWARRLAEYVARLSVVFAVSENRDEVDRAQVLRAIRVIDRAKEDVKMLVDELTKGHAARELDKVERFIRANPGITSRDLQRRTNLVAAQIWSLIQELIRQARIVAKKEAENRYKFYPTSATKRRTVSLSCVSSVSTGESVSRPKRFVKKVRVHTDGTDIPTTDTSTLASPPSVDSKLSSGSKAPTGASVLRDFPELGDMVAEGAV